MDAIGYCRPDRWTCLQGTQHDQGSDSGPGQLFGHILCDAGEAQHMDVELLPSRLHRFQIPTGEVLQAENQGLASGRLLDDLGVRCKVGADSGADEIGAV